MSNTKLLGHGKKKTINSHKTTNWLLVGSLQKRIQGNPELPQRYDSIIKEQLRKEIV